MRRFLLTVAAESLFVGFLRCGEGGVGFTVRRVQVHPGSPFFR